MGDFSWPYYTEVAPVPNMSPFNFTIPIADPDEVVITRAENGWSVEYNKNQLVIFTEYHDLVRWLSERYDQLPDEDDSPGILGIEKVDEE